MYFDVMGWWEDNKVKFPKIFPTAIVALTKPPTNAFVERGFSLTSWFDSNRLMRRQLAKNFEMRTMDCQTRALRDRIMAAEKLLCNVAAGKQAMVDEYNKTMRGTPGGEKIATNASTRSLMDLTTYFGRFNTATTVAAATKKKQTTIIQFVKDGSTQRVRTRTSPPATTLASSEATAPLLVPATVTTVTAVDEDQELDIEVDDDVDDYPMKTADDIELVDISYHSDSDDRYPKDLLDVEDSDVVLLQSLQEQLEAEESGVINVDERPTYRDHSVVDMTGEERMESTYTSPKRKGLPKDDANYEDQSIESESPSKKARTPQREPALPPRTYTPRRAKARSAVKATSRAVTKKKTTKAKPQQKKGLGKKTTRKVKDMMPETDSEEEVTEEEEAEVQEEEDEETSDADDAFP
jgi:hypothetical protein